MWQVVSKYVYYMPDEFVKAKLRFDETVAGKLGYQRWTTCVQGLIASMDMTMARMFVDAHFDENTKSTVKSSYSLRLHWFLFKKRRVWLLLSDVICDFHVSHNAIPPPQILHILHIFLFSISLGTNNIPLRNRKQHVCQILGGQTDSYGERKSRIWGV